MEKFQSGDHIANYIIKILKNKGVEEDKVYKKSLQFFNEYFKDRELKGYTDCPQAKAYNVGCMIDYMDYTPRTLKEIIERNE